MQILKNILGLLTLMATGFACTTVDDYEADYFTTEVEAQDILDNRAGALVFHLPRKCFVATYGLVNIATGALFTKQAVGFTGFSGKKVETFNTPVVWTLPEGAYIPSRMDCFTPPAQNVGGYRDTITTLQNWITPLVVKNGQVRYPGSITFTVHKVEYGQALSVLEKLNGTKERSSVEYKLFSFEDKRDFVRQKLEEKTPQLVSRLVVSIQDTVIEKSEVVAVIDEYFATYKDTPAESQRVATIFGEAGRRKVNWDLHALSRSRWVEASQKKLDAVLPEYTKYTKFMLSE